MKAFTFCILVFMGLNTCKQEEVGIKYVAQTRGFYLQISIESNTTTVMDARGGAPKSMQLPKDELEALKELISNTDFENIGESTSSKSSYDAAAMASLTIHMKEENHEFDFDHGYPPKKLELLVNKIITLSEIVE